MDPSRRAPDRSSLPLTATALVAAALLTIPACGGGGGGSPAGTSFAEAAIGPAGGTLTGPSGAAVVIPAGALATTVTVRIEVGPAGAPGLPGAGETPAGAIFALTPHGTAFSSPATVTIPFDAARVPSGRTPTLYKAEQGGSYAAIPATVAGGALTAQVSSFSYFAPVALPARLKANLLSGHCLREPLDGLVWCWGDQGEIAAGSGLGVTLSGSDAFFPEPTRLPQRAFAEVVVGGVGFVCGITNGSEVWCIGDPYATEASGLSSIPPRAWVRIQLPTGVDLYRLSAGGTHVCGIGSPTSTDRTAVGKVFCWGDDLFGQLGRGGGSSTGVAAVAGSAVYAYVAAGGGFTCASQDFAGTQIGGTVDCWGSNLYGAIAPTAAITRATAPYPRGVVVATRPGALSAFGSNACGIENNGTAWCWGDNFNGQKGDGTATTGISGQQYVAPSQVVGGHSWKQIAPGPTACGIDTSDVAWCWGSASGGSLGTGQDTVPGGKQTSPAQVAGPNTFVELSSRLCGRTAGGDVSCWGSNRFYDLGLGQDTPAFSNVPVPIKAIGLSRAMP